MSKTFMITGVWGRVPHLYIRTFDLFGETWVIHTRRDEPGYRCSHKETGYALHNTDRDTIKESLEAARAYLEAIGEAGVKGMIASARAIEAPTGS
jgi:hypothetical protein